MESSLFASFTPPVIILELSIIITVGLIMGRLFEKINIPDVTGYLVAGLLLGPISALLGYRIISENHLETYHIISNIALGFIAYQVGTELWFGKLKKTGVKIIIITLIQALLTTLFIIILLLLLNQPLPVALVLGAIGAATAPAPIMILVKKYKTKGELTDTILPVIGLDDAVGVIMFGVLLAVSVGLIGFSESVSVLEMIFEPLKEIGLSIAIGVSVGLVSGLAIRSINMDHEQEAKSLNIVVITVFFTTGLAMYFHASGILTPMIAGTVVTNMINKNYFKVGERSIMSFIPPLMIIFFTMAGAELDFQVLSLSGIVALGYIIGRIIGKYYGTYIACRITKSSKVVTKYLGLSLLPQSGVAIGLASAAYVAFSVVNPSYGEIVKNVTLAAVLLFELFGPVLVKIAFTKAGEVRLEDSSKHSKMQQSLIFEK